MNNGAFVSFSDRKQCSSFGLELFCSVKLTRAFLFVIALEIILLPILVSAFLRNTDVWRTNLASIYNHHRTFCMNEVDLNVSDPVAKDLVSWLIQHEIDDRPFADEALMHPYLLPVKAQYDLLHAVANQHEVATNESCYVVKQLNSHSDIYDDGWKAVLPEEVLQAFCKRHYDDTITSLLRFMRNVDEHITDQRIPQSARQRVGDPAQYFLHKDRFSILPMLVHKILRSEVQSGGNAEKWIERPRLKPFFCKCKDTEI